MPSNVDHMLVPRLRKHIPRCPFMPSGSPPKAWFRTVQNDLSNFQEGTPSGMGRFRPCLVPHPDKAFLQPTFPFRIQNTVWRKEEGPNRRRLIPGPPRRPGIRKGNCTIVLIRQSRTEREIVWFYQGSLQWTAYRLFCLTFVTALHQRVLDRTDHTACIISELCCRSLRKSEDAVDETCVYLRQPTHGNPRDEKKQLLFHYVDSQYIEKLKLCHQGTDQTKFGKSTFSPH
jgi:hypothetical protein